MSDDLRAKLAERAGPVFWRDLRAHARRGGLLVVAPGTELLDVAVAIAQDDMAAVKAWLESGHLEKPELETLLAWDDDLDRRFVAVVVQPFALAQLDDNVPTTN